MTVVYEPERRHHCGPNEYGYWMDHWNDAPGTVRRCDCGKSWVAYEPRQHGAGGSYYMGLMWRREGWWERRRRELKAAC